MRKVLFILANLNDTDLIWLSRIGVRRQVAAGEDVIVAGRAVDDLYFILDGRFEAVNRAGERLAELGLGDVVGEMSFVEKRVPDASVRATETGRVLAVPRDAMQDAFEQDPGMGMRFYRALAVFLSDRLRAMSGGSTELDEVVLDSLQQSGERFGRLVAMLEGRL